MGLSVTNDFWPKPRHFSEKALATDSSTLAWKIPWMEEPGRLQSMRPRRVRHDWATSLSVFTFVHWRSLENPRDGGAWWAAVSGVAQSRTRLEWLSSSSRHFCLVLWDHTVFHPFVLAGLLWHLCRRGRCSGALLLPGGDRGPGFLQGVCWHLRWWRLLVSPGQQFGRPTRSSLTLKRWGLITPVPVGWEPWLSTWSSDTIWVGVLGHFVTVSREWTSRLPTWPLLAWVEMEPQV